MLYKYVDEKPFYYEDVLVASEGNQINIFGDSLQNISTDTAISHCPDIITTIVPKLKSMEDNVNHPVHYNNGGIECIDAMIAAYGKEAVKNFCICNAFKYQWRFLHKNGTEDIDKAIWYNNKFKELSNE